MRIGNIPKEVIEHQTFGWNILRLSVEAPERVHGWDAIILTAASENQAFLYDWQMRRARERGLIPGPTQALVVPDPLGCRIGSGGATINALAALAAAFPGRDPQTLRVLLIHSGGDSKRLPWANVFGKLFIPFPLLADPDRAIPTLFDQLLAISAPVAARLQGGGLFSLSGDVLPIFNSAAIALPDDGALVVTTPVSLDIAGRHGVIVADDQGTVKRLLQKASAVQLMEAGALVDGGAALVDTGVMAFTGRAFADLLALASQTPAPVDQLVCAGKNWSLYEDLASAFVPAHHQDLLRAFDGANLVNTLGRSPMRHHRADELQFIHLGSTPEVLEHFRRDWYGELPRRLLAEHGPAVAHSTFLYASELAPGARVGGDSLIISSRLGECVEIGNQCVVVDLMTDVEPLQLPDHCCLWQIPVMAQQDAGSMVTVCCGVFDNPKETGATATFCNRQFADWREHHGVAPETLWPGKTERALWSAKLFPAHSPEAGLDLVQWLLDPSPEDVSLRQEWLAATRYSLAELHQAADVRRLQTHLEWQSGLILRAVQHAVDGRLDRNLDALIGQLPTAALRRKASALTSRLGSPAAAGRLVPRSRRDQIRADLLRAAGRTAEADAAELKAFTAVRDEVRAALRPLAVPAPVLALHPGLSLTVRLPVRFDFAGGWSDTPPYCLERPAGVLNFALSLNGEKPVGVEVEALREPIWDLTLADADKKLIVRNGPEAGEIGNLGDPFTLLRTALVVTGYGSSRGITQGVRIRSWARVPRGSGLGTSSILGAAIVQALQRLAERPDDSDTVCELVLNLEQMMTTGGGWQDQVGGLVPGVKFISSTPIIPMRLRIDTVPLLPAIADEFQKRFVVAYTGQDRLAKNVLQIVVGRYFQRDRRLISSIEGLVQLAEAARKALAVGRLDDLGAVLREVWQLHQQLDPHCSNPAVDAIFRDIEDLACGAKLAGAGGGGFMGVLAKTPEAAKLVRRRLATFGHGVQVYDWALA